MSDHKRWVVHKGPNDGFPIYWIHGSGYESVCDFYSRDRDEDGELLLHPFLNAKTNAEFIVKAVNSYPDTLEALRKIVNNWGNLHPKDRQQAKAAIAKAIGEEA